jgi:N-acetylglucosaminyl-diphospho-decaprenol L-rhamnosyltransferase
VSKASSEGRAEPSLAVVTVSYGSAAQLRPWFASLATATTVAPLVVVADNKPEDEVASLAREHGARYVPLPHNPGYGGAVNAAVSGLPDSVRWIVVSNPDVDFQAGALDALRRSAETDDRIGSVGPAVLNDDGSLYPSARAVPSLRMGTGHALLSGVWANNPWSRAYRALDADPGSARDVGWLSGSCVLVRRAAFEEIGGFDERYFMYFEDVDLGYRLGRLGYRNRYEPTARVVHHGAHSTSGDTSVRMIQAHHESARRFVATKYPGPLLAPVRLVLAVGLRARAALHTRRARRAAAAG